MARKQVGMVDAVLLEEVDRRALELGQTRRTFMEWALRRAIDENLVPAAPSALQRASAVVAPANRSPARVAPHMRLANDALSHQAKKGVKPIPKQPSRRS